MTHRTNVTEWQNSVTNHRDTSRARRNPTGDVTVVTRDSAQPVTVTKRERDSDMPSPALRARARHHHAGTVEFGKGNWMHLAALNLIADADAGVQVDPVKLKAAREIVARDLGPKPAPARAFAPGEA